jgi:competence protein ComEC
VRVFGVLEKPSDDINGFNYENYLAGQGIWLTMQARSFEVIRHAGFSVRGSLFAFKKLIEERLNGLYFEPEASFSAGLLIGSRRGMPQNLSDAFREVGLMHIVAISGSNISLVIYMISFLLVFLPFKRRMIVASAAVLIFVCLVGASAAVVRAGFMGVLGLFGLYFGKKSQAIFALLWSAIFMVALNPLVILYDSGFQLSFSATLGLLCFVPILDKAVSKVCHSQGGAGHHQDCAGGESKISFVREALLMTVAAQIATFPVTTFSFNTFSLIAPIANVLAAPLIPFAMLFSGLSIIFGKPLAAVATFYLKLIEWIALSLSKIPYVSLPVTVGPIGFILLEIALISFLLVFYKSKLVRAFGGADVAETSKALSPQFEKREKQ